MKRVGRKDYAREYFEVDKTRYLKRDEWAKKRISDVLSMIEPLKQEDFVIDLGCGIGTFAIECAGRNCNVSGIDYSKVALDIARELLNSRGLQNKVSLINANADVLPLLDSIADKVICADLVEHLYPDQFELMLQEVARTLKNNGELIIYTPNPQNITSVLPVQLKRIVRVLLSWLRWNQGQNAEVKWIEEIGGKYDYLHVDLKKANDITRSLTSKNFKVEVIRFTRAALPILERIPFIKGWFGGHALIKATILK